MIDVRCSICSNTQPHTHSHTRTPSAPITPQPHHSISPIRAFRVFRGESSSRTTPGRRAAVPPAPQHGKHGFTKKRNRTRDRNHNLLESLSPPGSENEDRPKDYDYEHPDSAFVTSRITPLPPLHFFIGRSLLDIGCSPPSSIPHPASRIAPLRCHPESRIPSSPKHSY